MTLEFSCIVGSKWNQWNITRGAICLQILVGLGTSGKENRRKEEKKNRGKKKKKKKGEKRNIRKGKLVLTCLVGLEPSESLPNWRPCTKQIKYL